MMQTRQAKEHQQLLQKAIQQQSVLPNAARPSFYTVTEVWSRFCEGAQQEWVLQEWTGAENDISALWKSFSHFKEKVYELLLCSFKPSVFAAFERHSASNPALGRLRERQKQCENGQVEGKVLW